MGGFAGAAQHLVGSVSRNVEAVFFKFGFRTVHNKGGRMMPVVSLP